MSAETHAPASEPTDFIRDIVAADLDGDGDVDLVTANQRDRTLSVLHGNGDGTLRVGQHVPIGSNPLALLAMDHDRDGDVDLVAGQFKGQFKGGAHRLCLNRGDGTFAGSAEVRLETAREPCDVALGDLDNDGRLDVVALDRPFGGLHTFANLGGSVFGPQTVSYTHLTLPTNREV